MGEEGGSRKNFKYALILFNLLFLVAFALCIYFGWSLFSTSSMSDLLGVLDEDSDSENLKTIWDEVKSDYSSIKNFGYVIFAAAGVLFLIALLGCCGACFEVKLILTLYSAILIILLCAEITVMVFAVSGKSGLEDRLQQGMLLTLRNYDGTNEEDANAVKKSWDALMTERSCCGVNNDKEDFQKSEWFKKVNNQTDNTEYFPPECCSMPPETSMLSCSETSINKYKQGCYDELKSFFMSNLDIVTIVCACTAGTQLFGIILAFCLLYRI